MMMYNDTEVIFDYGNRTLANTIMDRFRLVNFQGISGTINFDTSKKNGHHVDRPANLHRIVNMEERLIAHSNETEVLYLHDFDDTIPDIVVSFTLPHIGIVAFFLTLQCLELICVVILHLFSFAYRNTKLVKASSPKLVHAAYFGVYTFIMTMMLYAVFFARVHSPIIGKFICQTVWAWLMPLSFTLAMGIVSLRTWRIYRIFKHYLNPGRSISNPVLFLFLLLMVSIDILIGTIWTTVDSMEFYRIEHTPDNGPTNVLFYDQACIARYNTVWLGIVFTYKFVLLSVMMVLSLLTRRIPNKTFATTTLRVFSYTFTVVMVVGFLLYYLFAYLDPESNSGPILLCTMLNIMLLLYIGCILAPPLVPVIRDKLRKIILTFAQVSQK